METNKFLTPKQKQVLDFILSYIQEHDFAPSQQEIAHHFGFSSLGTVQHYLNQLQQLGHLQKTWNARRGMKASAPKTPGSVRSDEEAAPSSTRLPMVGKVAAGRPIEAVRKPEMIEVPPFLMKKSGEHFVLEVAGDSMIDEGIRDGDYVVIRRQERAENGETVVALVNQEATIKKFRSRKGRVELLPANPAYAPLIVQLDQPGTDFKIAGVLAGLIRRMP